MQRTGIRDQPAVGFDDAHASVIGHECRKRVGGARIVGDECARYDIDGIGFRRIVDGNADVIGPLRARDAQLDAVAGSILLPPANEALGEPRLGRVRVRLERPRRAARDEVMPPFAAAFEHEIDVVAFCGARIARIGARARRVAHVGEEIEIVCALADEHAQLLRIARRPERLRVRANVAPVVSVTVDDDRRVETVHVEHRPRRPLRVRRCERLRERRRRREQRLLLPLAQQRFGLPHELPAGPRQRERRERDEQEFEAEGHWSA